MRRPPPGSIWQFKGAYRAVGEAKRSGDRAAQAQAEANLEAVRKGRR